MIASDERINQAVEKFIKNEKLKDKLKEVEGSNFPSEDEISGAIDCAWDDLQIRTLKDKPSDKQIEPKEKITFEKLKEFSLFHDSLTEYFEGEPKNKTGFNEWHFDACDCVLKDLQNYYWKKYVCFGKAQKLVNMTFKYLYCFAYMRSISDEMNNKEVPKATYFKYCHMPLDSVMMEWFKRKMKEDDAFGSKKMPSWSNLYYINPLEKTLNDKSESNGYYTYNYFAEKIYEMEPETPPLKAEFVIWPTMRLKLATETFLKQVGEYEPQSLDKDLKEIQEKVERISEKSLFVECRRCYEEVPDGQE